MTRPVVKEHDGIFVVRDDLLIGGTKSRYLRVVFSGADEVVYASPAEGGAQFALASIGKRLGKRVTIFVAKRSVPHPRAYEAKALGAQVVQVEPGYLNVVQARARAYCEASGARLVPFGADLPEAGAAIAAAALATGENPDEIWCAGGSGVLARGLAQAWPKAKLNVVQVGRALTVAEAGGGTIHVYPRAFGQIGKVVPPFPADPHYEAKAWEFCQRLRGKGRVLFWNVVAGAQPPA